MKYLALQKKLTKYRNALSDENITADKADSILYKVTDLDSSSKYQNIIINALYNNGIRSSDDFDSEADQFSQKELDYVDNNPRHFYDLLDPITESVSVGQMINAVNGTKRALAKKHASVKE